MSNFKNVFHDYGLPFQKANDVKDISANIEYLYQKLKQATKKLSFWDLYKITTIIENEDELDTILNNLLPFSAAILNTSLQYQNQPYTIGDVFYKDDKGSIFVVRAERSGIYYPKQVVKVNGSDATYEIIYATSPSAANEGEVKLTPQSDPLDKAYTTIKVTGLTGDTTGSPYNKVVDEWNNNTSASINFATEGSTNIDPIIRAFDENNEEIYNAVTRADSNGDSETEPYFTLTRSNELVHHVVVK